MNLKSLFVIVFLCFALVLGSLYYFNTRGPSITPVYAALICSKVVESKVATPFKVLRYEFSNRHTLLYVKSELLLLYNNDFKATATCLIKRNNPKDFVHVLEAFIINEKGFLFKVEDIKVQYTQS